VSDLWRRHGTAVVASLVALVAFWLALRSEGSDWYISQTHADILYSAIVRFHELPFFSFAFNGGTYFLQDPQNNLYSPTTPLILLAGPSVGLRIAVALYCGLGCWAFIAWMRRHVDEVAAQMGGVAWALGLGVLWRIAVGNDMFLWHLGLPLLFLLIEKLFSEPSPASAVSLGLAFGLFILGPTFHSFTYLVLPTLPIFVVHRLSTTRPTRPELGRIAAMAAVALGVSLVIASPKLLAWTAGFPMRRETVPDDVISLREGLRAIFDYGATAWTKVPTIGRYSLRHPWWGVEESAVALPPLATLLALVGAVASFRRLRPARVGFLGLGFVAMGLVLACTPWLWQLFRTLTHGNFRVAPRFLAIAGFGMSVLSALGAHELLARLRRAKLLAVLAAVGLQLASALWWIHGAGLVANRAPDDAVQASPIHPWARASEERAQLRRLRSFADLVTFQRGQRQLLAGHAYADGFFVVGNQFDPERWPGPMPVTTVEGMRAEAVTFGHTRIALDHLSPEARVRLRVLDPRFGFEVRTSAGASVDVTPTAQGLVATNHGPAPADRVEIVAKLPISAAWFFVSPAAILLSATWLLRRHRAQRAASASG
jgi:hypothetical protein